MLWVLDDQVAEPAWSMIESGADAVYVSAASIWEIEIKRALGKLRAPSDVSGAVAAAGFEPLPITFEHAQEAGRLPPLHSDPFDRLLIAQARSEGMTLATADQAVGRYDVPILAVSRL